MKLATLATLGCSLIAAGSTMAAAVTPTYTTFGPLPGANFGGSGNPTDPVAITTIQDGNNTITLGLAAQQRYSNPPLANNGAGTFYATPGLNGGLVTPAKGLGATWNFDYYVNYTGSSTAGYTFKLFMGQDTASPSLFINPLHVGDNKPTANNGGQNSENLSFAGFGNLGAFELNPLAGSFDANANADYSFVLKAYNAAGAEVGASAIVVSVAAVPDAGSTALLLGSALAGIGLIRRKMVA